MAKEQKQEPAPAPAPEAPEALGPPKSYRLHIALGMTALILFQVIVLWLLLPPRQVEQIEGLNVVNGPGIYGDDQPPSVFKKGDLIEKPIKEGKFSVNQTRNEQKEKFSLLMFAKVTTKEQYKFQSEYDKLQNTIIAEIDRILWASTPDERGEPARTIIREKAKKAINALLPVPYVQEVIVHEVNYEVD